MKILEYIGLDTSRVKASYRKVVDAIASDDFRAARSDRGQHRKVLSNDRFEAEAEITPPGSKWPLWPEQRSFPVEASSSSSWHTAVIETGDVITGNLTVLSNNPEFIRPRVCD